VEIQSNLTVLGPATRPAVANSLVLKVGQILPVTVVKILRDTGQAQLDIGGRLVKAESALRLTPGQTLTLEVIQSGPLPKLKIIGPFTAEAVRERALLNNISLQKSPVELARQVLALSRAAHGTAAVPAGVRHLAQSFLAYLPDVRDLATFQGVKHAVTESGVFLEARLAQFAQNEDASFAHDLKAGLLRFAARAEASGQFRDVESSKDAGLPADASDSETETQLHRALAESARGALSRMVLNQAASLPADQAGRQAWHLEIPFLTSSQAQSAQVTIQRESGARSKNKESQWTIAVELNPPNLGTLQSKICLSNNQVSVYFRTESESTRALIQANLNVLEKQLDNAGLAAGNLATGVGLAREKPLQSTVQGLVDARA
jgi:Flagellar hook-length control protein FliK